MNFDSMFLNTRIPKEKCFAIKIKKASYNSIEYKNVKFVIGIKQLNL